MKQEFKSQIHKNIIEGIILVGPYEGTTLFIPRITLAPVICWETQFYKYYFQ